MELCYGGESGDVCKIDMARWKCSTENFIKDGTDASIKHPYGIAVNPVTKDIYVTDAKSYVVSGTVYCFSKMVC